MAGRANVADLRICAVARVEGRFRLVPVPPGTASAATEAASVEREGTVTQ